MEISNLRVGMIVKNYKDLCSMVGIEPKSVAGSNSRKAQEKELSRYIKWEKITGSNKLMILEIYNDIRCKVDTRSKGNNSKYVDNIENIILYTLSKHETNENLILSRGKLLEVCNMINQNYREGKKNISKISEITDIESDYIYNFYSHSNTMLSKSITTGLKALRNRRVIDYYDVIMICENVVDHIVIDGEVKLTNTGELIFREATDMERKDILKCEKEAIRILGMSKIQDVVIKGKWKEFKKLTESIIRNRYNRNLNYYYSAYKLIYNTDDIREEISLLEVDDNKSVLNTKVSATIAKSTKTRHTKAVNGNIENKLEIKNDYIEKQLTLLELLVKDNPKTKI